MDKVDTLIRMFPVQLMTMDMNRLISYEQELKDIRDLFLEFSTKLLTKDAPRTGEAPEMNVDYWQVMQRKIN